MSESEQIEPVSAQQPGESFGEWLLRLTPAQRKKLDEYLEDESYCDFLYQQAELRAWEEEQRAKAPEIPEWSPNTSAPALVTPSVPLSASSETVGAMTSATSRM